MSIYVKFDGIDGDATEENHKKWIEVSSLQFGFGRGITTPQGAAARRETSTPSVSEITFTKEMDIASSKLFTSSLTENAGKVVKIDLCKTGDSGGQTLYTQYTLTNALISSYQVSSGGDRPTESVSLNFTKLEFKYIPFDDKNKAGTAVTVSYDLASTKSS